MLASWPNAIVHLDGDAFFASCEQAIHPELKGRPVITGAERNIVSSMSYEAKARGIKRAVALWQAKQMCPEVVILPSDYETYSLISKRLFSIMRRFTPDVEESSIDEGYCDLKGLRRLYRTSYEDIAHQIQQTIERELDIPISLGLSVTKILAKLASKYKKPHGFTAVPGYDVHLFLKQIPVGEVCGFGPNTTALLLKQGVRTVWDYVSRPEAWVKKLLGKIGIELWLELRGQKVYTLNTELKSSYDSISKTKTFTPPSDSFDYVKAQLLRNTESAFIKARRYSLRTKRLIVYLKQQDFKTAGFQIDLNRATSCHLEAFKWIEEAFKQLFVPRALYRATGVVLLCLEEDGSVQFDLFEDPVRVTAMSRLSKSVDEINRMYGKHTVAVATGLYLEKRKQELGVKTNSRNLVAQRKQDLLKGETYRQHLNIPVWNVRV